MNALIHPRIVASLVLLTLSVPLTVQGFEPLTVKQTNYSIPTGALFVSPTGDDNNPGTQASPFRTVDEAISRASSGDTIVLREGVYREGDHVFSKRLTFQPYPNETAWMKGSVEVTSWTPSGSYWRHDNWEIEFDQDSYDPSAIDPNFPHAGKPDMVFVDGLPLRQVGSLNKMASDTFYVDYDNDELYVGADPSGKTIEAAAHRRALRPVTTAHGTTVRGLGFMHYASKSNQGALQTDTSQTTFENNTVAWSASRGMAIFGADDTVVRGNKLIYNGLMGLVANQSDRLVLEDNRLAANNQERFEQGGVAAEASGAKITRSEDLHITGNTAEDNFGIGLWLDLSVADADIVSNVTRNNKSYGILYEVSEDGLIAGNIVTGNEDGGIGLSNTARMKVYNNTLVNNETHIEVLDDSRSELTEEVVIKNNLLSETFNNEPMLLVRDFNSSPIKDAEDMIDGLDFNGYFRSDSSDPAVLSEWWRGTTINEFADLAAFQSDTGFESSGLGIDDVAANPFFNDPENEDYRLLASSVARGAGEPLPADVATALGLAPGVAVHLGAIQNSDLDGDYNNDGQVDLADYTMWRKHLGAPEGTLLNDPVGGVIGVGQYQTWKSNFGASLSGPSTSDGEAESQALPEPAASVLLLGPAVVIGLLKSNHSSR